METSKTITVKTMTPLYHADPETAKLHISKGNAKIGNQIWSFSTLPGDEDHLLFLRDGEELLTDIPGTCSKNCDACFGKGCYAVNSARMYHKSVIQAWAENTVLLRSGRLFKELDAFITEKNSKHPDNPAIKLFRINVSGEVQSGSELMEWNRLATKHPETTFGLYTKNYEALEEFMDLLEKAGKAPEPETKARNFVINVSEWHGIAEPFLEKHPGVFNVFEYDDSNRAGGDEARMVMAMHCPAVTKKGHHALNGVTGKPITCSDCRRCYRQTGERTAVWAH